MAGTVQDQSPSLAARLKRLDPGDGAKQFLELKAGEVAEVDPGLGDAQALLSSISAAIRARAVDHSRSTERTDMSSASEVSPVVKPAK